MDWLRSHALALPVLVKFAVGLGLIIIVPQICGRLHIPGAMNQHIGALEESRIYLAPELEWNNRDFSVGYVW